MTCLVDVLRYTVKKMHPNLRIEVVLLPQVVQFFLLLVSFNSFEGLVCLIVQYHQVAVADVEPREVIARVFGVEDVLVNNKCGPSSLWSVSYSDLSDGPVLAEDVVHLFPCDFVGKVSNVQDTIHFWGQSNISLPLHRHRHGSVDS